VGETTTFLSGASVENGRESTNPYVIDAPAVDEGLFFGREKVLAWLAETLGAKGTKRVGILRGSYRIGKTSLLHQLQRWLPQTVFLVDLSMAEEDDSLGSLLWRIAASMATTLAEETGRSLRKPELNDFLTDADYFHAVFLPKVYRALRRRRLVLAFDEVESLEDGEGSLRESFYTYLSVLMNGDLNLSLVLALEEWPEWPPAVLDEAFRWRLGSLDHAVATELITEPASGILEYDYHAVRQILDLTSGHPYFTQLLCHLIFRRRATGGRVSAKDVENVVEEAMELSSPYMERLWDRISLEAGLVLAALAHLRGARGIPLEQDLRYLLGRSGAGLSSSEIGQACQELVEKDVLEGLGATSYRFRVELVRMWLAARRKLDSVLAIGRTKQVAATAGDWMGRFLWPLIGLLLLTAFILWCLASSQPIRDLGQARVTPIETQAESALSYVLVTPTPDLRSTPTPVPTRRPPTLDIAYMLWDEESSSWEICARSRDGLMVERLTDNDVDDTSPVWSHDHTWLVFVSERDGNQEIYRMDTDGSEPVNLTRNRASDWTPSVSPDGTKVVFSSLRDGNWELYMMNADGSQPARMTFNEQPDYGPVWSPDGSRIAFVSERDGNLETYVMKADGTGEARLTRNSALDLSPAWSPDGSSMAFESHRDGNMEIYVMNADGTGQRNLTNYPTADDHGPTWTEDGLGIVFYSNRDGNWDLYLMNAQGSDVRNLTDSPAIEQEPFWSS
jgi:hypothetical protein